MTKKQMLTLCNNFNIAVPEGATNEQLLTAIREFSEEAAAVKTDKGVRFIKSDKETKEYIVQVMVYGELVIRAENEDVAMEWVKDHVWLGYVDGFCSHINEDWVDNVWANEIIDY